MQLDESGPRWAQYRAVIAAECMHLPDALASVPINGATDGGRWMEMRHMRAACNDKLPPTVSSVFAKAAIRAHAAHCKLRLSQVIHEDAWSH